MYKYVLLGHVIGATIWTGGHLVLSISVLPKVLREKSPARLLEFESAFEKVGIPALLVQVITGLWLAHNILPKFSDWWSVNDLVSRLVIFKICLLILTVIFAVDARFRIIPNLTAANLISLAYHIIPVTIISVLFVVVGVGFRTGGFP